ncbi:dATP/dGTP diphosphohydrolase domain-containing protein [Terrisporobacter mayombei]|uniref:dATP/dGTP diphosphohydrolase N-terminal domain-containing protein n=1 Tax=Terrisporobacter mayombei TaxID=1541 RepID=A0ABY9PW23_9FIRM|nr:dATP/dGTP diphosphohydrolase domain-containing protein [Terrisporobacter mayombei]MCC3870267.1 DUF5664 domain-containing protein [Terrisporobacter mayombei]WMT79893.1 hypothetical protein TEMA_01640 [Terrisporobacter mayombei]
MIIDSGDRTEYSTGAKRDLKEGKGRCDLMPLDVVSEFMNYDTIIHCISNFKEKNDVEYLYDALENSKRISYGNTKESMILDVSIHFEEGAKKYGENNWQKGIPVQSYIDSAVRHYLKHLRGDDDENHLRAFVWNILCLIWTVKHKEELGVD